MYGRLPFNTKYNRVHSISDESTYIGRLKKKKSKDKKMHFLNTRDLKETFNKGNTDLLIEIKKISLYKSI